MRNIPFSPPDITENEISEVIDALRSGWITTGPKTKELERLIAIRSDTSKAVCLNSNTACAEMTLRLLGIGAGDEVIVPAYTYTASASVVAHVGGTLVLVDCEPGKFSMDYDKLEAAITEKTKVIIPVELFGIPCDYDRIFEIINRKRHLFRASANPIQEALNRVIVLTDGAHSFGATIKGRPTASYTDFITYSFHAVKNLTTAEGGAVTWRDIRGIDNDELYSRYMLLSLHGQSKDALAKTKLGAWEYDVLGPWYKCNMTDVHAAIGLAQIKRYDSILRRRKEMIEEMNNAFTDLPVSLVEHYSNAYQSSGHLYIVRLDGFDEEKRNQFILKLANKGISSNVHYKPLPMMTAYQNLGFKNRDYPNAYEQYRNEITLPLHTCLNDDDIDYMTCEFREILKELRK